MRAVLSSEKYGYSKIDKWHKLLANIAHSSDVGNRKNIYNNRSMGLEVSNYRVQNSGRN